MLPSWGSTHATVKTMLQGKLMKEMKPNMARIRLTVLRACLSVAVEEGRLTGDPAARNGKLSSTMTVDMYGHLIPATHKAAMERVDDATRRNPGATGVAGTLHLEGKRV